MRRQLWHAAVLLALASAWLPPVAMLHAQPMPPPLDLEPVRPDASTSYKPTSVAPPVANPKRRIGVWLTNSPSPLYYDPTRI